METEENKHGVVIQMIEENFKLGHSQSQHIMKSTSQIVDKDGSMLSEMASLFNYISITTGGGDVSN